MNEKKYLLAGFGRTVISLGKAGEEKATRVEIDVSAWAAEYPDATYMLYVSPPEPLEPYFAEIDVKDNVVGWTLKAEDTIAAGNGMIELILMRDGVVIKSQTARTSLTSSPSSDPAGNKPHAHPTWWREALTQIKTAKDAAIGEIDGAFDSEVAEGEAALEAAGAAQQAAIENKGKNTLNDIPEGWTQLDADVKSLKETKADAIVCEKSGEIVSVDDASDKALRGLKIFGKTTQDGTPTPAAPVPLVSIGEGGSVTVYARGRNLFNISNLTSTSVGVTSSEFDGEKLRVFSNSAATYSGVRVTNELHLLKGQKYTFSAHIESIASGTPGLALRNTSTKRYSSRKETTTPGQMVLTYTPSNDEDVWLCVMCTAAVQQIGDAVFTDIQFEAGVQTSYEPYQEGGSAVFSTPNGLPGIPVSSGGNYTDASGQMWICDEIDCERGVYVKRINTIRSSAMVSFTKSTSVNSNGNLYIRSLSLAIPDIGMWSNRVRKSNHQQITPAEFAVKKNVTGSTIIYVCSQAEDVQSVIDEVTAEDSTLMYALLNPIETPLTEDEIEAYRAMRTIRSDTTVYNDAGAGQIVHYAADTKIYIDKKFDALAAALIGG
ncbi:MAG: hypothetical protein IKU38_08300 [Clostridia bacterium]|nr:hypothetical protein [Clostridia bacterium]